jgi:hypothetical protein
MLWSVVRRLFLLVVALLVGVLFVRNVLTLADETGPAVWVGAGLAAVVGAGLFFVLLARPPAVLEKLRGVRGGILPILAAGIAVLVVGSASAEGQLISLALFAGFLAPAVARAAVRRPR